MAKFAGLVTNGSYTTRSRMGDSEKSFNLFAEVIESGEGRERFCLYSSPGRQFFTSLPDAPVRCLWAGDHRLFAIAGGTLFEIFEDGTFHNLASVAPGTTPAQIFASVSTGGGTTLFITSAGQGYNFNGTVITPVIAAGTGTFLDGYAIAAQPNSKQFNISGIDDFSTWNPLEFGVKEGWPDNIAAVYADHELLWLLGFETTEVWYDSGAANFPFTRIQSGGFIQHGCVAPFSVAKCGESIMWLAGDQFGAGWVIQAQGLVVSRVSNHAMEYAISQYSEIQDAFAYGYQDGGHFFWLITFPTADATWVYDLTTGQWHRRGLWDPSLGVFHADLHAGCLAYGSWPTNPTTGIHFTGDMQSGAIYTQSVNFYSDAGQARRWLRASPHLSDEDHIIGYGRLELLMQRGVAPQGLNPQVMMRYSDDGGFTWSRELWRSCGVAGQYKNRVIWRALGSGRDRVFEISGTDPVEICLVDAYLRPGQSSDT